MVSFEMMSKMEGSCVGINASIDQKGLKFLC